MSNAARGISFYVCLGPWARPRINRDGPAYRLCLGWISMAIVTYDIEQLIGHAMERARIADEVLLERERDAPV